MPDYGSVPTKSPVDDYSFEFNSWYPQITEATRSITYIAKFDKYKTEPAMTLSFKSSQLDGRIRLICTDDVGMVNWDGTLSHDLSKTYQIFRYEESHSCKIHGGNITSISIRYDNFSASCYPPVCVINLSNQITSIPDKAFYHSRSYTSNPESIYLSSITIPDSVTSIGSEAFSDQLLSEITFGNHSSLNKIDSYAFQYCDKLSTIVIPNGVTSIGINAFEYCESMKSVFIPKGVTTIGLSAFSSLASDATIYCEDESKPAGWADNWTDCQNIVWGYTPTIN